MASPKFKPDLKAEPWRNVAQALRQRGEYVTPLSLGFEAGRIGLHVNNPYRLPASHAGFRNGYRQGKEWLAKRK